MLTLEKRVKITSNKFKKKDNFFLYVYIWHLKENINKNIYIYVLNIYYTRRYIITYGLVKDV